MENQEITVEKIRNISKKVNRDETDYIYDTIMRLINKYTTIAQDGLTQKYANECLEIVKNVAMEGKTTASFVLCNIDIDDYYLKEFNNKYWSWTNILTCNKKEYDEHKVTNAFNLINKKYEMPDIKIKMYSWHDGDIGQSNIVFEAKDNNDTVTNKSCVLCLGYYIALDKIIILLVEKYFPGFKIEIQYCRYSPQVVLSLSW